MKITHVAAEIAPLAKVGGLADVLGGLSKEQQKLGNTLEVLIPKYDVLKLNVLTEMTPVSTFKTIFGQQTYTNKVWKGKLDALEITFIDPLEPLDYFRRGAIYAEKDDAERFLYFSKACYEYLHQTSLPDIVHLHDWQTAVLAYLLHQELPTVLTIHNLNYQGHCHPDILTRLEIDPHNPHFKDTKYTEAANLLKGGIHYATHLTTVSPTYSQEILTPTYGEGLETVLTQEKGKLIGIINGIDTEYWNPKSDKNNFPSFSETDLSGKQATKFFLKKTLNLDPGDKPLFACITRLVPQKGLDLIKRAIYQSLERDAQIILLGSSPIESVNLEFEEIRNNLSHNNNISIQIAYDELLAKLIYAGSDFMLVPSLFEPCGLAQLIALRYGTIPVVRETGGLYDTVRDIRKGNGNGFSFKEATHQAIDEVMERAINFWNGDKKRRENLVKKAILLDHSWQASAKQYLNLYNQLIS